MICSPVNIELTLAFEFEFGVTYEIGWVSLLLLSLWNSWLERTPEFDFIVVLSGLGIYKLITNYP